MKEYYFCEGKILLKYSPEVTDVRSILKTIEENGKIELGGIFTLSKKDVLSYDEYTLIFIIGEKIDNYYVLNKIVFEIEFNFMFHEKLVINKLLKLQGKHFKQGIYANVIAMLLEYAKMDIRIVPDDFTIEKDGDIPFSDYCEIIEKFPNQTEIALYKKASIEAIIGNYFSEKNSIDKYNSFLNKRRKISFTNKNLIQNREEDIIKYEFILNELENMLKYNFSESEWQKRLLPIILLLYPKYLKCFSKVKVSVGDGKYKELDFLLVDADGNVDLIELKKPFELCVLRKGLYRNNYIAGLELTGAIQQIQKYLYYLSSFKELNEQRINEKYKEELSGLKVKIINPQAIIICGRSNTFDEKQKEDYEIIKRQYKSVAEILTYDELILRLKNSIRLLKS
ncbi:MAG: DUF4263 domain-containing protein [Acholeplasmatales bacterium]|jgi:hypothetical protein|nr:DUF4263 domain-containing protein [Acholeplasmatales bacterium]